MILSQEHDDCLNWARWDRDNDPGIGYRKHWSVPIIPAGHTSDGEDTERSKHDIEADDEDRHGYDEARAVETNRLFQLWLRAALDGRGFYGKRMYIRLHAVYRLGHTKSIGELEIREALRALCDLKEALRRPADAPGTLRLRRVA